MPERAGVAAVIVDYYSVDYTRPLVESLGEDEGITEVVVVDNSGDPNYRIKRLPVGVRVVKSAHRKGYGAGVNLGARCSEAAYLLALNSDLSVSHGRLSALVEHLVSHPGVGLVSPLVLDRDGNPQADAAGRFPRRWGSIPERREWRTGAAFMMRRHEFESLHGFDERYFMYWEDTDLCLRLHHAGLNVATDDAVAVLHASGGSDGVLSSRYRSAMASRDLFLRRWNYPVSQRMAMYLASRAKLAGMRVRRL